jgi:hypothetical protein
MNLADESANSIGSSVSNFSIQGRCKAHCREISNNFTTLENFRNDLIEEEILMENCQGFGQQPGST